GKLANFTATELGGLASVAAIKQLPEGTKVDSTIYGNVVGTSAGILLSSSLSDAPYLARHIGLRAGLAIETPGLTINRLCGSGFQSVINAAQEILLDEAKIVLAGGTESMSQAPHVLRGARTGARFGIDMKLEDSLASALTDSYPTKTPMGITAENLGKMYGITRQEVDEYALMSQQRWAKAHKEGIFKSEIAPVELKSRKGVEQFDYDEHARPETTIASLQKLKPVFIKDIGLVTAGNASGISDGACSLVVAGEEAVKENGIKPLARIVDWYYTGCEPTIMGIGPVPAIQNLLKRTGISLADVDLVEINEAFAAQVLACVKELGLDVNKVNQNGGSIAMGHPLGASGARILTHLTYELHRTQGKYAIGSACIGGGQGIAVLLERV
ncbi:hypothetical protein HDV02_003211, partial [Globomyces sp. JEL0801]